MSKGLGTSIMVGFKSWDTRRRNELRHKALNHFTALAKANNWCLPSIGSHPKDDWGHRDCCVELSIDFGRGCLSRWFKTRAEAGDYLIDIAPHCRKEG